MFELVSRLSSVGLMFIFTIKIPYLTDKDLSSTSTVTASATHGFSSFPCLSAQTRLFHQASPHCFKGTCSPKLC